MCIIHVAEPIILLHLVLRPCNCIFRCTTSDLRGKGFLYKNSEFNISEHRDWHAYIFVLIPTQYSIVHLTERNLPQLCDQNIKMQSLNLQIAM